MPSPSIALLGATIALAQARRNLAPIEAEYKRLRDLRDEADARVRELALEHHQATGEVGSVSPGVEVRLSTEVDGVDSPELFQWVVEKAQHFLLKVDRAAVRKNKERLASLGAPIQIRTMVPAVRVSSDLSKAVEAGGLEGRPPEPYPGADFDAEMHAAEEAAYRETGWMEDDIPPVDPM